MSSKFANAFAGKKQSSTSNNTNSTYNSEEAKAKRKQQNAERVAIFKADGVRKGRVGIISGAWDLGIQPTIGRAESKLSPEEEAKYLAEHPTNWFGDETDAKTKVTKRYKYWNTTENAVAIAVDFPQFKYDWGGDIGEKSFRFVLNGTEFTKDRDVQKGLGRIYSTKETKKDFPDGQWSLGKTGVLYKLAVATEIIKPGEVFKSHRIGELIGKAAYFEVSLSGEYANEDIAFKGTVPEGIAIPEVEEDELFFIRFDIENDINHVKQIRWNVLNQMKRATDFEGSILQQQLESLKSSSQQSTPSKEDESSTSGDNEESEDFDEAPF